MALFWPPTGWRDGPGRNPLVNPVLIAVALVAVLLKISGTDYQTYFNGAQFVHFLLGPATVALGVPLYRNLEMVGRNLLPMLAALLVGASLRSCRLSASPPRWGRRRSC